MQIKRKRDWMAIFSIFAAGMLIWLGSLLALAVAG
jgi:hypothetical protein